MKMENGRVYQVGRGDEEKWRALAEYACEVATGQSSGIARLRQLRDAANYAVVMGPDGAGNVCRLLIEAVNLRCDPRAQDGASADMERLAGEVLNRCHNWRTVHAAARSA